MKLNVSAGLRYFRYVTEQDGKILGRICDKRDLGTVILLDIILKGLAMNDVTFQVPVQSSLLLDDHLKNSQVLLAVHIL
jgi:hypothetical protein